MDSNGCKFSFHCRYCFLFCNYYKYSSLNSLVILVEWQHYVTDNNYISNASAILPFHYFIFFRYLWRILRLTIDLVSSRKITHIVHRSFIREIKKLVTEKKKPYENPSLLFFFLSKGLKRTSVKFVHSKIKMVYQAKKKKKRDMNANWAIELKSMKRYRLSKKIDFLPSEDVVRLCSI